MQVLEQSEAFMEVGEDLAYSHTVVILREGEKFYYANTKCRGLSSDEIDPNDLELRPIPIDDFWPPFPSDFTSAPDPVPADCFIKRPSLVSYDAIDDVRLSDLLLEEARTCEILRKHPHPNIAQYLGCTVERDRITGLCFVKYSTTLADRLNDLDRPVHKDKCWNAVKSGIEHLHSLGLVHNDLNPYNIMLKPDDAPVIIDFDSCRREDDKLLKGGTWGWADENAEFATPQNDYYGLKLIYEALDPVGTCTGKM